EWRWGRDRPADWIGTGVDQCGAQRRRGPPTRGAARYRCVSTKIVMPEPRTLGMIMMVIMAAAMAVGVYFMFFVQRRRLESESVIGAVSSIEVGMASDARGRPVVTLRTGRE